MGKPVTASRRVERVLELDSPDVRNLVASQLRTVLTSHKTVLLDEWQNYPPVWDGARRLIDEKSDTRFLFTGSATPIENVDTHSGAGRIISLRMRPLALSERPGTTPKMFIRDIFSSKPFSTPISGESNFSYSDYAGAICSTGFPQIETLSPRARRASIDGSISRIVDRDFPEQGLS